MVVLKARKGMGRGLCSAGMQVDLCLRAHASSVLPTWTDYGNISTPRGFARLSSVHFRVDELQKNLWKGADEAFVQYSLIALECNSFP